MRGCVTDKSALEELLPAAKELASKRLTPASAATLDDAIDAVEAVIADEAATQEQVDAAAALQAAIDGAERWLFDDVKDPSAWYFEVIYQAVDRGLVSGYFGTNLFGPNDKLTRGQVATILYRAAGSPEVEYTGTFSDVKDGQYYSLPVEWAVANGVVTGYSNGTFRPNNNITRQDLMVMLARYMDAAGGSNAWKTKGGAGQVSPYAQGAIAWGVDHGVIGSNGQLNPKGNATRAEATKMILVALDVNL